MDKKIIQIIAGILAFVLVAATLVFSMSINKLSTKLKQNQSMLLKMQDEVARLKQEEEATIKEKEKLQADSVSYLALNTKLQEDKDRMKRSLDDAQRSIEQKESELQRIKQNLERAEKKVASETVAQKEKLAKEKKAIEKKMALLAEKLKKERALYHYNLGVAYSQAKLYDESVEEYGKSLKIDPDNADAHYNMALIYDTVNNDAQDAALHYRKYLELRPNAPDRDEVEASIGRLK